MLSMILAAALCPQGPGTSTAPVVINEFSYDDGGTDDLEYVELYNRSGAPVDISGWTLVNPDDIGPNYGTPPNNTGNDPTYTIPANTILAPGGFWLMGSSNITGVNQILGTTNLFENSNEALELRDLSGAIVDSLCYEIGAGAFGPHPIEGNGFYGDLALGGGTGAPHSCISRILDGYDTDDNGRDFVCNLPPTPGFSNNLPGALPYVDTFDTGSVGSVVPAFNGGWVDAVYVDPTQATAMNPSAKPPSPQGGLGMATWDFTGGGNTVSLVTAPVQDVVIETYVYIQPVMSPYNPALYTPTLPPAQLNTYNYADGEWWAVGARGTASANGNPPDVGGYFAAVAPGVGTRLHFVTGVCWAHFRTVNTSELYLLDLGNGAAPGNPNNYTIIGGPIAIQQGVNDGWQRIRLHLQGNTVIGNFGGTYGFDDGTRFVGTTTANLGGVYVAYREAVLYNNNGTAGTQPPIFDLFDVHAPTSNVTFFGTGSPTSAGTPAISPIGLPILGSAGFGIQGSSLVPLGSPFQGPCFLFLGLQAIPTGFPIPGAPTTALGYLINNVTLVNFADATGNARWPLGIPANAGLAGLSLHGQIMDFDTSIPMPLPIGMSNAMTFQPGN
ncbi:MAG: hypothetical protein Fur0037_02970 [Planctomycetota bacterium]